MFLRCAVKGESQQVMLEGMLLPVFPVPLLDGDAQRHLKMGQLCASFPNRMCSQENTMRKRS